MRPIIYQLLPRLFTNVNAHCVTGGTLEQNGSGKLNDIDRRVLRAIRGLGATHVWYTGVIEQATCSDFTRWGISRCNPHVVKGQAGSPYAIRDYYDISPELAVDVPRRMAEFEALVERTHQAGLKVIIDFVPNHVAREYGSDCRPNGVRDLGQDDDQGKFFDPDNNFYYLPGQPFTPQGVDLGSGEGAYHELPARATGNDCWHAAPGAGDWYETVKLNYGLDPWNGARHFDPVPDTWHKMLHILRYWAGKGIDGLRCDMVHMVPVEFWHWAITQVKNQYPHLIFIAEIYDTALYRNYLHFGGFDYLYDKVTLYDTLFHIVREGGDTQSLTACWQQLDDIRGHMLSFVENHDEVRLASPQFAGSARRGFSAMAVCATLSAGPLMVYAGQELGERGADAEGFSGHDGRTTIFDYWSVPALRQWLRRERLNGTQQLRDRYKRLLNLCASEAALARGALFDLMYANAHLHRQCAFLRHHGDDVLLVCANFDDESCTLSLAIPAHAFQHIGIASGRRAATELLHGTQATLTLDADNPLQITVSAFDAVIWKFKR
ncbi:MAG: alpha-amylase family protein [Muribaculaceae bacterium]|nr:alpha-amylase family protein [Muribaculaceae bacterium]